VSGGGGGGERTEKATPKRVKKARKDGQIGNTPEIGSWLALLVAGFLLPRVAHSLLQVASDTLIGVGAIIRSPDPGRAVALAGSSLRSAALVALPLGLAFAGIGVASVAAQGGLWFSTGLLKPKFSRLNPLSGIKRMFGGHAWWQLLKSLIKSLVLAAVVYFAIRGLIPSVMGSGSMPLQALVQQAVDSALGLVRYSAIAGLIMALADYVVVRRRNNKQLKMTKEEVKEEFKSSEGDPHVRSARRSRQMAMRRNRMMQDVPKADVVLVNPTHVAVALKYEPGRGAPRVVAKGADHVAARIRALAEEHRVPMVVDVPLARTLHKSCEVGQEIPADLFKAVATVLAFIMTLKRRGSAAGTHTVRPLTRPAA
jgi:flagellar biosynthetic protein FlhB